MNNTTFKYSLNALIKKREWELSAIQEEVSQAASLIDEILQSISGIGKNIEELEINMRDASRNGTGIDPHHAMTTREYLIQKRKEREDMKDRLADANKKYEELFKKLNEANKAVLTLQKHKKGQRKIFNQDLQSAIFKEADSIWLSRRK